MLSYWILRRPGGAPAGLVRVRNDCATLLPTGQIAGVFTLFSADEAVPIVPESETVLPGAEAVLGVEAGEITCFASAQGAKPASVYRNRISQIYTNKEKPAPQTSEPLPNPDISQNSTIETEENQEEPEKQSQIDTIEAEQPDSILETAQETESFSLLLNRAEAFYAGYEETDPTGDMVQKEDIEAKDGGIDLFREAFPGARWRYVDGADILPHYEGTWRQPNGGTVHILAVRGRAAPRPPRALWGFTRYLRDRDGTGYWLRITPLGSIEGQ